MAFLGLFRKKPARKPRVRTKQKVSGKTETSVVTNDAKYGHIMKEFGVIQKELKEVKQALGLLRQAEEQTYSEVRDQPAMMSAVIEREIGELSKRLDKMVSDPSGLTVQPGTPEPAIKSRPTALMSSILDILKSERMTSGEIFSKLQESGIRAHEKSVPRALRKLIDQNAVKAVPGGAANLYEKCGV